MSGAGGADTVHGVGTASPRWWRRFRDVPLVVLAVLTIAAAVVGWMTQYRIDAAGAAPAAVAPAADDVAYPADTFCRPVTPQRELQPWIDGDPAAATTWNESESLREGEYVAGRDGWTFHNDQVEENFSQAIGRRFLSVAEVAAWHSYLAGLSEALSEAGVELSIQITPSVTSVYPQQLPEWTSGIIGSTPLDQLLAAASDLPMVDFRQSLQNASESNAVYTPVNSHWTDWGGYIGWQTYAACRDESNPDAPRLWVPVIDGVESAGIYNEFASSGVPDAEPEWTKPIFADSFADVDVTANDGSTKTTDGTATVDLPVLPASTSTQDSRTPMEALILRDSMGSAFSPYWGQNFAKTWQIQHRYDDWSNPPNYRTLVDLYHPDIVIIQLAERHLANAPPKGITAGY